MKLEEGAFAATRPTEYLLKEVKFIAAWIS
jgi:hypothetical protein